MMYKIYLVFQCFGPFEDYVNYKNCGHFQIWVDPLPTPPPLCYGKLSKWAEKCVAKKVPKDTQVMERGVDPPPLLYGYTYS